MVDAFAVVVGGAAVEAYADADAVGGELPYAVVRQEGGVGLYGGVDDAVGGDGAADAFDGVGQGGGAGQERFAAVEDQGDVS